MATAPPLPPSPPWPRSSPSTLPIRSPPLRLRLVGEPASLVDWLEVSELPAKPPPPPIDWASKPVEKDWLVATAITSGLVLMVPIARVMSPPLPPRPPSPPMVIPACTTMALSELVLSNRLLLPPPPPPPPMLWATRAGDNTPKVLSKPWSLLRLMLPPLPPSPALPPRLVPSV